MSIIERLRRTAAAWTKETGASDGLAALLNQAADALAAQQDGATVPTIEQVNSACMSYRHDFGLLKPVDQALVRAEAREWLRAWQKEGLVNRLEQTRST